MAGDALCTIFYRSSLGARSSGKAIARVRVNFSRPCRVSRTYELLSKAKPGKILPGLLFCARRGNRPPIRARDAKHC